VNFGKLIGIALIGIIILIISQLFWKGMGTHKTKKAALKEYTDGPHINYQQTGIETTTIKVDHEDITSESETINRSQLDKIKYEVVIEELKQKFHFELQPFHDVPDHIYEAPSKIVVLSDVEGDFVYMRDILLANGVMNKEFHWSYGDGRLVVLGDIFDRGNLVTESLWLLYKLEKEAKEAGGQVHVILGNHEAMALSGDDRYVNKKYRKISSALDMDYNEFFGPKTVLGDWLRSKNSIEVIGNTLFVHGGISPKLVESGLSISEVNEIVRSGLGMKYSRMTKPSGEEKLAMGRYGPLWYRAYVEQKIEGAEVLSILKHYDVGQIVIGHTMVKDLIPIFDNRIYPIDVDRVNREIQVALMIDNNSFFKIDTQGTITAI